MSQIPPTLIDQLARGEVTLFLGAGAAYGCMNAAGEKMPLGDDLRDKICDEFLQGKEKDRSLKVVSNFAENQVGLTRLNKFIAELFSGFKPNVGITLFPNLHWLSIYSTNYDLTVEQSYKAASNQELVSFTKDMPSIDKDIAKSANPLPFYKLHGSVDKIYDRSSPIVLTTDSYVNVKKNRTGLFNRLVDDVHKSTVVFIGTELADPHIEGILADVEEKYNNERPMHYIVSPKLTNYDRDYYASRRITCIQLGVDEFMTELNAAVDPNLRALAGATPRTKHPIQAHFNNNREVPADLLEFVTNKVEYVHRGISSTEVSAQLFFKGVSESWSPIQNQYDIKRDGYESTVLNVLLQSEKSEPSVDILSISGVAGSGKTTFLRRLAYDLSVEHNELVVFASVNSALRCSPFVQLFENTGKRAVLIVDSAADQVAEIERISTDLDKLNIPITIVIADTKASFGDRLDRLGDYVRQERALRNLSEGEIDSLLVKLKESDCLHKLESLTTSEQKKVFTDLAQKQLLVALYEATQGRPLEELLVDEYHRILLSEAQELYLLVATLHRFDIPVRAGLVSRVMGIRFTDFEKKFLSPLEGLVYTSMDHKSRDYVYRTRHPQIAEIVFSRVLDTQSKQVDQYSNIIASLNPTFSSDDQALKKMISFRSLLNLTTNSNERRLLLRAADEAMPDNPFVTQQMAILEMNTGDGDLTIAGKLLEKAAGLSPYDVSIKHSLATLVMRRADESTDTLRSKTLRAKAKKMLKALRGQGKDDFYIQVSLGKLAVSEIERVIKNSSDLNLPSIRKEIIRLVSEAEKEFGVAEASGFRGPSVAAERAKLRRVMNERAESIHILESTLTNSPDAKRVAVAYNDAIQNSDPAKGRAAIEKALISHPNDKRLNQSLYLSMLTNGAIFDDKLEGPLMKSFTLESDNVLMHIHALRYYFGRGDVEKYNRVLGAARQVQARLSASNKPTLGIDPSEMRLEKWQGEMTSVHPYFAFIKCTGAPLDLFCSSRFVDQNVWDQLVTSSKVTFALQFNLKGAIATDLALLS